MIGRLVLEWRTQQALEYKKRTKQYTKEEIFQDDQMVYLLAPHLSALQDPELQNTLKNASYRGGWAAN